MNSTYTIDSGGYLALNGQRIMTGDPATETVIKIGSSESELVVRQDNRLVVVLVGDIERETVVKHVVEAIERHDHHGLHIVDRTICPACTFTTSVPEVANVGAHQIAFWSILHERGLV